MDKSYHQVPQLAHSHHSYSTSHQSPVQQPNDLLQLADNQLQSLYASLDDLSKCLKRYTNQQQPHLQSTSVALFNNLKHLESFLHANDQHLQHQTLPFGLSHAQPIPQQISLSQVAEDNIQSLQYYNQLARGKKQCLMQFKQTMEKIMDETEGLRVQEKQQSLNGELNSIGLLGVVENIDEFNIGDMDDTNLDDMQF